MPEVGHNTQTVASAELRSFIERVERLSEERDAIGGDIKDVYAEAGGRGYDVKIMKKVIALRKKDASERAEEDAMLDVYLVSLGMKQVDLFEAA